MSSSPRASARRGQGHRIIIAHMFLPDTIEFQEEESDNEVFTPLTDDPSVSASPKDIHSIGSDPLPLHELQSRLEKSTPRQNFHSDEAAESHPLKEKEKVQPTSSNSSKENSLKPLDPSSNENSTSVKRSNSNTKRKSRPPSFSSSNEARKINMSSLINEATQGQSIQGEIDFIDSPSLPSINTIPGSSPRSRRSSPSGNRPVGLTASSRGGSGSSGSAIESDIPLGVVSDHGRSATTIDSSNSSTNTNLNSGSLPSVFGTSPKPSNFLGPVGIPSSQSQSQSPNLQSKAASGAPRSRRGSGNTSGPSGMALTQSNSSNSNKDGDQLSGTKTPGKTAAGRAGLMTPLSIIGDLAAKQSALAPLSLATPGDSERHHPFGSGAVTPMRGSQTPGSAVRDVSRGGATLQPAHRGLSRPPASLAMSKANSSDSLGTTAPLSTHSRGSMTPSSRPPLGPSKLSTGRVASAVASGSINDHGRGAQVSTPPTPLKELNPTTGGNHSSSPHVSNTTSDSEVSSSPTPHPHSHSHAHFTKKGRTSSSIKREESSAISSSPETVTSPNQIRASRSTSFAGPPPSASSHWSSKKSKSSNRSSLNRRTSSLGRVGRRASMASIDTNDSGTIDGLGSSNLPPYEFIPNPSANGGLINAVSSLARDRDRLRAGKLYVGTPGIETEGWLGSNEKFDIEKRMKKERDSVPVWINDETFRSSYSQFCKQILWPTFHYTLPTQKGLELEQDSFKSYVEVNRRFADRIEEVYQEGDIIWVNDYHLLLLPQMLRERLPHATIGFFLHIAFPSSELFRCLSVREKLLRGMLGSDLIGFQTHNFCRHFRQTVSRILQLEATPKGISLDSESGGGFVTVSPFPIGIDVRSLNAKRHEEEVEEWSLKLKERYEGKKVIVGRDKLDWIKGVRQKLLAFEVFLNEHPEWIGKVVLIQVALATNEENQEVGEATDVVARINNKYSTLTYQPVVFLHVQDITFSQYLALLTIADAFLASSLREGMNLTTHEYVVCQEEKHRPLILSEFTGTYSGLRACIGINPWNTKQVAHAIHKALTMDENEMIQRWNDLHRTVVTQTAQHWITSLLSRLERAHLEQQRRDNAFIPHLEIGQLVSEWRAAKTRLLLLDLEDTLLVEEDLLLVHQKGFSPPERVIKLFQDLCSDHKNAVYLMSGKSTQDLDIISKQVPGIGLVAENGCYVKHCGENGDNAFGEKDWTSLVAGHNMNWKAPVIEILSYFTERTPGSWLEDRGASVCWRFWSAGDSKSQEALWSRRQAAEVQNLIYDSLGERFSLRIIPEATSFLIMPKNTSRASAVQHIISMASMGGTMCAVKPPNPKFSPQLSAQAKQTISSELPSPYKQPSNHWPVHTFSSHGNHPSNFNSGIGQHVNAGTVDFALAIGQDDGLLAYVATLDLPFAPLTCTTAESKGSEAGYHLGAGETIPALEEIVSFKARDRRWGGPAMVDI